MLGEASPGPALPAVRIRPQHPAAGHSLAVGAPRGSPRSPRLRWESPCPWPRLPTPAWGSCPLRRGMPREQQFLQTSLACSWQRCAVWVANRDAAGRVSLQTAAAPFKQRKPSIILTEASGERCSWAALPQPRPTRGRTGALRGSVSTTCVTCRAPRGSGAVVWALQPPGLPSPCYGDEGSAAPASWQHEPKRDRGDGGARGVGVQGASPCPAAAGCPCGHSPPSSPGAVPGSAPRMRRPRRRQTPGLMVLPGALRVSGAETGLGLKSLAGVLGVQGGCSLAGPGDPAGEQEEGRSQNPRAPRQPARLSPAEPRFWVRMTHGDRTGTGPGWLGLCGCCPTAQCPVLPQPCPGLSQPPLPLTP